MAHVKAVRDYNTGTIELKNDKFIQLYEDHIDLIIKMTTENPAALRIFLWIIKFMDRNNALVISQVALAEVFRVSERAIRYSIKYLKDEKALTVLKSGNTNVYHVNAQVAWKSTADGKKHAVLDAKVYLTGSEQTDERPAYKTQLVGHAQPKTPKPRPHKVEHKGFSKENDGDFIH